MAISDEQIMAAIGSKKGKELDAYVPANYVEEQEPADDDLEEEDPSDEGDDDGDEGDEADDVEEGEDGEQGEAEEGEPEDGDPVEQLAEAEAEKPDIADLVAERVMARIAPKVSDDIDEIFTRDLTDEELQAAVKTGLERDGVRPPKPPKVLSQEAIDSMSEVEQMLYEERLESYSERLDQYKARARTIANNVIAAHRQERDKLSVSHAIKTAKGSRYSKLAKEEHIEDAMKDWRDGKVTFGELIAAYAAMSKTGIADASINALGKSRPSGSAARAAAAPVSGAKSKQGTKPKQTTGGHVPLYLQKQ